MGLLDDAIRDHLELKRRRGADPAEIERAERDALGPARRDPDELHPDELQFGSEPYPLDESTSEHEEWEDAEAQPFETTEEPLEDALDESPAPVGGDSGLDQRDQGPAREHLADAEPTRAWSLEADEEGRYDEVYEEDRPEEVDAGAHASAVELPGARDEMLRHSSDEELEAGTELHDNDPPEDVLEETPDFLQDTPDHDRLWFEQRPPRDFDFGG